MCVLFFIYVFYFANYLLHIRDCQPLSWVCFSYKMKCHIYNSGFGILPQRWHLKQNILKNWSHCFLSRSFALFLKLNLIRSSFLVTLVHNLEWYSCYINQLAYPIPSASICDFICPHTCLSSYAASHYLESFIVTWKLFLIHNFSSSDLSYVHLPESCFWRVHLIISSSCS